MASALQHPCFFLSQSVTFLPVFEQHASPLEHFFDVESFTLSLEQLDFFPELQDLASALLSALASFTTAFFALSSEHFFTVCSIFTFSVFSVVVCATTVLHKKPTSNIIITFSFVNVLFIRRYELLINNLAIIVLFPLTT